MYKTEVAADPQRGDGKAAPAGRREEQKAPPAPRGTTPKQPPRFRLSRRWIIFALVLLALNVFFSTMASRPSARPRVPYSPFFLDQVRADHVKEITSKGTAIQGTFTEKIAVPGKKATTRFRTEVPAFANNDALSRLLEEHDVVVNAQPLDKGLPWWQSLLLGFGPTILFIGLLVLLMRRAGNVQNLLGSFGRSRATRYEPTGENVTFEDVAGIEEAKAELSEVVDFLRHPEKYRKLGARIPHGVLLAGPPGTGKTLLARAVAGEAGVPFFAGAASEFVEAIVGVGASRVRDLFKQAKEAAPAIIFVDELDAIGRSRSGNVGGLSGGNDEREQTLNQILTEMDGFAPKDNVIVLGATNRPEVLDPALLRPGRFDRRIAVQPPDKPGRVKILEIHTRSVPLDDVDLEQIAASTPGMTGADLALLVNESALFAARHGEDAVHQHDFTEAIEKIILGTERQIVMTDADRERTAYHESGHALVGMLTPGTDPVRKISIIPRGQALGVTLSTPESDRYGYEREELIAKIKVALGGRAAERVVYGETTTGAESDIQQLTQIARGIVGRWGMSDVIGPVAVIDGRQGGPLLPGTSEVSEHTQRLIDEEVRRVIEIAEQETIALVERERARLEALARALLERETLDQPDAYEIAGVEVPAVAEAETAPA